VEHLHEMVCGMQGKASQLGIVRRYLARSERSGSMHATHVHLQAGCVPLALGLILLASCGGPEAPGTGTTGSKATAPGQVTVAVDKQRYGPSETIVVTITNGLSTGILAADHQSNCTTVVLERLSGGTWQAQNPCPLKSPTRLIPFGAGTATQQQLRPQGQGTAPGWSPGTYRVAFTYMLSASGAGTTVYSSNFTIG
jgi:hypothetical protein